MSHYNTILNQILKEIWGRVSTGCCPKGFFLDNYRENISTSFSKF